MNKYDDNRKFIVFFLFLSFCILSFFIILFTHKKEVEKIVVPEKIEINYKRQIKESSNKYEIDPFIIAAVINAESGFNKEAESHVGALGLMQLMPDTIDFLSNLKNEKIDDYEIFKEDVDKNIDYGSLYLKYLHDKYRDWNKTFMAYNAGMGNLDSWLEENPNLEVEEIPFPETKEYVIKINRYLESFKYHYSHFPKES